MRSKHEIRQFLKEKRGQFSPQGEENRALIQNLTRFLSTRAYTAIAGYYPLKNEVDSLKFLKSQITDGKYVFLPRLEEDKIEFARLTNEITLEKSRLGTLQPNADSEKWALAQAQDQIEIWLVPALGFSKTGHRIGFGKGYYDRFLAHAKGLTIGMAFDWQILDEKFEIDPWDVPVSVIVTPTLVYPTT